MRCTGKSTNGEIQMSQRSPTNTYKANALATEARQCNCNSNLLVKRRFGKQGDYSYHQMRIFLFQNLSEWYWKFYFINRLRVGSTPRPQTLDPSSCPVRHSRDHGFQVWIYSLSSTVSHHFMIT